MTTHDTLMLLAHRYADTFYIRDTAEASMKARDALSTAIAEVLAERDALAKAAYLAGFNASGEGYNGEYPFNDRNRKPADDEIWVRDRDNALASMKGTPT